MNVSWAYSTGLGQKKHVSILPLAAPLDMDLPKAEITATVASGTRIDVTIESQGLAAYVWLSTLAAGRFSRNAFWASKGVVEIEFIGFGKEPVDTELLKESLRVEHLAEYLI